MDVVPFVCESKACKLFIFVYITHSGIGCEAGPFVQVPELFPKSVMYGDPVQSVCRGVFIFTVK